MDMKYIFQTLFTFNTVICSPPGDTKFIYEYLFIPLKRGEGKLLSFNTFHFHVSQLSFSSTISTNCIKQGFASVYDAD